MASVAGTFVAGDRRTLAASLEHLSATYRDLGDLPRAHQSLLHAIHTYHTLTDPRAAHLRPYLACLQTETTSPRPARTWQFTDSPLPQL